MFTSKSSSQKMCFLYLFLFLFYSTAYAKLNQLRFGMASGYENLSGLTIYQTQNLFLKASISKEFLLFGRNYLGFEFSTRTGFSGPLNVSDELQDSIGGPTPIISSTPRLAFSTALKNYLGKSYVYILTQLGFDFGYFKFDRFDLINQQAINVFWHGGLGVDITKEFSVYFTAGSSKSLSQLNFNNVYHICSPYPEMILLLGFTKAF